MSTETQAWPPHSDRRRCLSRCSRALVGFAAVLAARATAAAEPPRHPLDRKPLVLVLGDSLSAEYGLRRGSGWVELLRERLAENRIAAQVVNASISGETTAGGRARLPALLAQHKPTHIVIELGGNDALRGLPLAVTGRQLGEMTRLAAAAGARVLLLGMQLPPNYGRRYGEEFAALYAEAARPVRATLVPFFLKGIADAADADSLFQSDRIHPREVAQARMLDNVWPALLPLLR